MYKCHVHVSIVTFILYYVYVRGAEYVCYREQIFVFRFARLYTRITGRMRAAHMQPYTSLNEFDNALNST